jgi:single-stranded DNA-binding protein
MISLNLTGRLTREPELRRVPDPSSNGHLDICHVRVAARTRRGETVYLDVSEWGASGRAAAERLRKGSMIAFTGELRFREQTGTTAHASTCRPSGTSSSSMAARSPANRSTQR